MDKILLALKSRSAWTIVAMFLVGGIGAVHNIIPPSSVGLVDGVLGILAIYFHLNPSQNYNS